MSLFIKCLLRVYNANINIFEIIDNITESQISVEELEKTEITDKSAMDNDSDIVALLREEN